MQAPICFTVSTCKYTMAIHISINTGHSWKGGQENDEATHKLSTSVAERHLHHFLENEGEKYCPFARGTLQ
jgi:hypothetical protein